MKLLQIHAYVKKNNRYEERVVLINPATITDITIDKELLFNLNPDANNDTTNDSNNNKEIKKNYVYTCATIITSGGSLFYLTEDTLGMLLNLIDVIDVEELFTQDSNKELINQDYDGDHPLSEEDMDNDNNSNEDVINNNAPTEDQINDWLNNF